MSGQKITFDRVIQHFGTQMAAAAALGTRQSTVNGWRNHVPVVQQHRIQHVTKGRLKVDPNAWRTELGLTG